MGVWIGDMVGREILEALEHRKEGGWGVDRGHGGREILEALEHCKEGGWVV